jgi:hypothetical protein
MFRLIHFSRVAWLRSRILCVRSDILAMCLDSFTQWDLRAIFFTASMTVNYAGRSKTTKTVSEMLPRRGGG